MPQILAINDIIKAQYVCSDSEQVSINTVYYKVTAATGATVDVLHFATAFEVEIAPAIIPCIANTAEYQEVICQVVNPLPLKAREISHALSAPGTGGAVGQARQVAGLIAFYTDLAGPGFRGRNYVPFPSTAASQAYGVASTAYTTALNNLGSAINGFATASQGAGSVTVDHVLYKRAGQIATPVVRVVSRLFFATQKKRGSYGKANQVPQ
jgi:hypothetical protein